LAVGNWHLLPVGVILFIISVPIDYHIIYYYDILIALVIIHIMNFFLSSSLYLYFYVIMNIICESLIVLFEYNIYYIIGIPNLKNRYNYDAINSINIIIYKCIEIINYK